VAALATPAKAIIAMNIVRTTGEYLRIIQHLI
jgi:hypothetical protein